jgi:aspartate/methionine/tyrosine aminotransferase
MIDSAYLRTLEDQNANHIMSKIVKNPQILARVVFIDSFSKTNAMPRERSGTFFAPNDDIFNKIFAVVTKTAQGTSPNQSGMVKAILSNPLNDPYHDRGLVFKEMQRFRRREVEALIRMMQSGKYDALLDDNQSHVGPAMGIYTLPKLREGVSVLDLAAATGCLGMPFKLATGSYSRLATGLLTRPTFNI